MTLGITSSTYSSSGSVGISRGVGTDVVLEIGSIILVAHTFFVTLHYYERG